MGITAIRKWLMGMGLGWNLALGGGFGWPVADANKCIRLHIECRGMLRQTALSAYRRVELWTDLEEDAFLSTFLDGRATPLVGGDKADLLALRLIDDIPRFGARSNHTAGVLASLMRQEANPHAADHIVPTLSQKTAKGWAASSVTLQAWASPP
jgi:hypothetical protein